jgi:hypothetical protein
MGADPVEGTERVLERGEEGGRGVIAAAWLWEEVGVEGAEAPGA